MELLKYKDKINKMIDDANNVFIMGHRFLDLDALGSSIGVAEYLKSRNKTGCIIVNDTRLEKGVKKALDILKNSYKIVRSTNIKNKINSKSLLIIVDTNKEYLLQDKSLLQMFKNILVIDHHDTSSASLSDG